MKFIVILCLAVAVVSADFEFKPRARNAKPGQAIHKPPPAFPVKRQATVGGGRPSTGAQSFRQQAPSQQGFRPPGPSFRSGAIASGAQQPVDRARSAPINFAPSAPTDQLFVPLRDEAGAPQRARQGPARPIAAGPAPSGRVPEYAAGFPEGFTSGLPAFDFQGRMPEPDTKSEGFMDSLQNFPSLKTFGGFDPLPDVARDDSIVAQPPKRSSSVGGGRPNGARPAQRQRREAENAKSANATIAAKAIIYDDEAMLEPDEPVANRKGKALPTDIQDIIANVRADSNTDSVGQEQRYNPTFFPTGGPYGRFPSIAPVPATPTGRPRRPVGPPLPIVPQKNRNLQRGPYAGQLDFVDDNSLLGSGNFDVLGGGFFRDADEYRPQYGNQQYYGPSPGPSFVPPSRPSSGFFPHQAPLQQLSPPSPPAFQFHPISPPQHNNNNNNNNENYQTSFFDDDFFSNFRDFADVNQDYRN